MFRVGEALLEPLMQAHLPDILNAVMPVMITDKISEFLDENSDCPHAPQVPQPTIDFTSNENYQQIREWIESVPMAEINAGIGSTMEAMSTEHAPCPEEITGVRLNGNCSGVLIKHRAGVGTQVICCCVTSGCDFRPFLTDCL